MRVLWVVAVLLCMTACGPSLQAKRVDERSYRSSRDCAQGPFAIEFAAAGARWGEGVEAWIAGDRPFVGRYRLELDGARVASGVIRSSYRPPTTATRHRSMARPTVRPRFEPASRQRCSLPDPSELESREPADPQPPESEAPAPRPSEAAQPVGPDVIHGPAVLVATDRPTGYRHRRRFLNWRFSMAFADKQRTLKRGARLRLVVWTDGVIDWRNTHITARHYVLGPNVPEAEYVAWLREKEAERRRERAERQREWREKHAKRRVRRRVVRRRILTGEERRRAIARMRLRRVVWKERRAWSKARRYVINARKPNGPPPAPLTENAGPQPDPRARWIDGRWSWKGRQWVWIAGVWEIPPQQAAVVIASSAPPATPCPGRCGPPPPRPCGKPRCVRPVPPRSPAPVVQVRVKLGKRPKLVVRVKAP